MNVRSATKKSSNRLSTQKENKQYGILNYDEDNCYPQRILLLTNSSPTTKACLKTYGRFIEGGGFKDLTFYKAVINLDGQTMDKILRLVSKDFARYRGFAIHCNVNASGKIVEVFHVPFENVRLATETRQLESGFAYAIYTDWNKQVKNSINKEAIDWLHPFNLNPAAIAQQAEEAGGWEGYKGQLIYVSADEGSYPLASCDEVLEPMVAEIQSDITTTTNVEENFSAKGVWVHKGKFADDEEKEEFEDDFEEFIGPEGATIIVVDIDKAEDKPEFIPIPNTAKDDTFKYTDEKIIGKIIRCYLVPKILLSVTDGGGFFNQEQVRDAVEFYNSVTNTERLIIEETFTLIGVNFIRTINVANDYSIIPFSFKVKKDEPPTGSVDLIKDPTITPAVKRSMLITFYGVDAEQAVLLAPDLVPTEKDKRLLIDIIGVGGVQAITVLLADATLTPEQKKNSLVIIFGLSDEDAAKLAGVVTVPTP